MAPSYFISNSSACDLYYIATIISAVQITYLEMYFSFSNNIDLVGMYYYEPI